MENEEEQKWIEYIHARYHEDGIKISEIARELNACGVPTKRNMVTQTSLKNITEIDCLFQIMEGFYLVALTEVYGSP